MRDHALVGVLNQKADMKRLTSDSQTEYGTKLTVAWCCCMVNFKKCTRKIENVNGDASGIQELSIGSLQLICKLICSLVN